jgi:hypothetical protein
MLLWLYASQHNGKIPVDTRFLERKLSCEAIDLDVLVRHGFLVCEHDASKVQS